MTSMETIEYSIESNSALYRAYMPFVRNGGLFVLTERPHELGDDVRLTLKLFDTNEPIPIGGKVVWVTPNRAQGKRAAGIGVQLSVSARHRARIEGLIADIAGAEEPTHTL